jgi:hypothetical protein
LRRDTLVDHHAVNFDCGLPETKFAEIIVGSRPRDDDAETLAKWKTDVEDERISLKNAHGKKSYKGVLCDQRYPSGGDRMQWRWYIVKPEAADPNPSPREVPVDLAALFDLPDHGPEMQSPVGASAAGYPLKGEG